MPTLRRVIAILVLGVLASVPVPGGAAEAQSVQPSSVSVETDDHERERRAGDAYGKLPMAFEPNAGRTDERARYLARGRGYSVFLTGTEVVLALTTGMGHQAGAANATPEPSTSEALRMRFAGAAEPRIAAERELPGKSNYLVGADETKWRRDVPTFGVVRWARVYDGVDAVFYGTQGQLEYDLVVAPGADASQIRIRFEGQQGAAVNDAGDLVLRMQSGEVRQRRATAFEQGAAGARRVAARYVMTGYGEVGLDLGAYDRTRPLVIDPALVYGTYFGGGGAVEHSYAIAVDGQGSAYVTGEANSLQFPTTLGVYDTGYNGMADAFVTKFAPNGGTLLYSTYLGGTGRDVGMGIAVDSGGSTYITGVASSLFFPTTPNAFDTTHNGGVSDAFVIKLTQTGNTLIYSTFLGGASADSGCDVAVGDFGVAYVTGRTASTAFPTTAGAFDTSYNGGAEDAFVAKLSAAGTTLTYSTFLGGGSLDVGCGIALDTAGLAYVTGETGSGDMATTPGAFDTTYNGGSSDAFVTKLSTNGDALVYSTFLGGDGGDAATGIAVHSSGTAYAIGSTDSTSFPTTTAAFDETHGGGGDAFVTRLTAGGDALVYSTYLGGGGADLGYDIAVDASGVAVATGQTASADFATTAGAFDTDLNGAADAFVTKLSADGSTLAYSTFLGGSGDDQGNAVAVVANAAFVAGSTGSTNFPTTADAFDTSFDGGGVDAFVTKVAVGGDALVYSTFLGSSSTDVAYDVAIDSSGAAYVTGYTDSIEFPTVDGSSDTEFDGETEAFVAKLSTAGDALVYSTFVGGSRGDLGHGLVVDGSGIVYATGWTSSTDFPTTAAAFDTTYNGGVADLDAFVAVLSQSGDSLVYSTYLGGSGVDYADGIAVDQSGSIYVTGTTGSANFPTTAGAFDTSYNGGSFDAYAAKLTPSAGALVYSTYLGGSDSDGSNNLALDASGEAYLVGGTRSTDFPVTAGAFDTVHTGLQDVFVTRLSASGGALTYSTYLGGSGFESGFGIGLDAAGGAYVTGETDSANFPTTAGAYDTSFNGSDDAYVTKLSPSGDALVYSTFLGGSDMEYGSAIAVDTWGSAYVAGVTLSMNFPLTGDALDTSLEYYETYVARIAPAGNALTYSTFLGGSGGDFAEAIVIDGSGGVYIAGRTESDEFATSGFGYHDASSGFVVKLWISPAGADTVGVYVAPAGAWFLRNANGSGPADLVFGYGPNGAGWVAIDGDWNGDGVDTPGLYDPVSGFFYLKNTTGPGAADLVFGFGPGNIGWTPVIGDWDDDGTDTVGLYDPLNGFFFLRNVNAPGPADTLFGFGPASLGWQPLAGDWNGDGRDTVGLYAPSTGFFFLRNANAPGPADVVFGFGPPGAGWLSLAGDWNGDGGDTVGLYDPGSGFYFLRNALAPGPADLVFGFGPKGAAPLIGDWDGQ